jgi:hypothetical protein
MIEEPPRLKKRFCVFWSTALVDAAITYLLAITDLNLIF